MTRPVACTVEASIAAKVGCGPRCRAAWLAIGAPPQNFKSSNPTWGSSPITS